MGQRSQIYIAYCTDDMRKYHLVARYFQWNFGSRMVSRTRHLLEWLETQKKYLKYLRKEIERIPDINFDFKDIVISQDLIVESKEYGFNIFSEIDNNDGKLFILVKPDGEIKYALTDNDITRVMSPDEYMKWNDYKSEEEDGSNCAENCRNIKKWQLLTIGEINYYFLEAAFDNV